MLCAMAVFVPAAAAEDEIFVDPGSPSGKEYALPIDSARRQAAREAERGTAGRTQRPPLFGEGVDVAPSGSARGGQGAGAGGGGGGGSTASGRSARELREQRSEPAEAGTPALQAQAGTPDGGVGALAIIGGASVAVLLLGGGIGLLLRRRASSDA